MKPISFRGFPLNDDGLAARFARDFQRPSASPIVGKRQGDYPLVTGVELDAWELPELGMLIDGDNADADALRLGLLMAFDAKAGPGALIVADDDGANERYLYVVCRELTQKAGEAGDGFVATFVAQGDVYWQAVTPATAGVTMNDVVKTFTAVNGGDVDTYPTIEIDPSSGISGNSYWRYRIFCAIKWTAPVGAFRYSIELTDGAGLDTAALISGSKIGGANYLDVITDGARQNRWYAAGSGSPGGYNSASTRIWSNMHFRAGLTATLASDDGNELAVEEDISAWPASGIIQINSELFTYTGRDLYRRVFTGVSGAAYGSSAGTHTAGDIAYWIQHEVWIVYSSNWQIPGVDDGYKPIFDLSTSSNAAWIWSNFYSASQTNRPAQWTPLAGGQGRIFTGNEDGAAADPAPVAGMALPVAGRELSANYARWQIYLPCGVDDYDIDGSDYLDSWTDIFVSDDGASWQFSNLSPSSGSGWSDWNESDSGLSTALRYIAVQPRPLTADCRSQIETAEITFQSAYRPIVAMQPEQSNYQLTMLIENLTTGESLELSLLPGLKQAVEGVVIDTEARTVVIDPDGRNIYHAQRRDTLRQHMLRLAPGDNSMRILENPSATNLVTLTYHERWYL